MSDEGVLVDIGFFGFLFIDKKAIHYWSISFVLMIILSGITFLSMQEFSIGVFLLPFVIVCIYFTYYATNYFTYKKYFVFIRNLNKNKTSYISGSYIVEVYMKDFSLKLLKENFDANIKVKPYKDFFQCIKLDKIVILFCKVRDFGVFQRYIDPLFIVNNELSYAYSFKIKKNRVIREAYKENSDMVIVFSKNIDGLNKLRIINYY